MRLFRGAGRWVADFLKGSLGPAGPVLFALFALFILWVGMGIGGVLFVLLLLLAVGVQVGDRIFYQGEQDDA